MSKFTKSNHFYKEGISVLKESYSEISFIVTKYVLIDLLFTTKINSK